MVRAIYRWYYKTFHRERCFRCTLEQRVYSKSDPINYWHHTYLGENWWLISKEEYERTKQTVTSSDHGSKGS